jgi:pimeloyl-ACP methyl ester carboxylesterase
MNRAGPRRVVAVVEQAEGMEAVVEPPSARPPWQCGRRVGGCFRATTGWRSWGIQSAAVHEPPLWGLCERTRDRALVDELAAANAELATVGDLISSGDHRAAAEPFSDRVALRPGAWDQLPEAFRAVLVANGPRFLDELADPTALSIDTAALATTEVPLLVTQGTESPPLFAAVIAELLDLVLAARRESLGGAGHIPHATHPDQWVAYRTAFHDQHRHRVRSQQT